MQLIMSLYFIQKYNHLINFLFVPGILNAVPQGQTVHYTLSVISGSIHLRNLTVNNITSTGVPFNMTQGDSVYIGEEDTTAQGQGACYIPVGTTGPSTQSGTTKYGGTSDILKGVQLNFHKLEQQVIQNKELVGLEYAIFTIY